MIMKPINISDPKGCHLRHTVPGTHQELRTSLIVLKTYEDDSHLIRNLMKCKSYGQLYFHEFFEEIGWVGGNDAQYSTYIPVDDEESADQLSQLSVFEILKFLSLRVDFPTNASAASAPFWTTPVE